MGEPHRAKLTRPRWQAAYDLAMGRTLAVMVRTKTYNAILAKAKQGMKFRDPKNDTWLLKPSEKVTVGTVLEKQAAAAREYLERTVEEHEGTPWAMLAARELREPLGWEWAETYTGVNEPPPPRPGGGNRNRPNDRPRVLVKPKPRRTPKL
jgi:LmbE family N-acetylglucosaminyl deacetylase